MRTPSPHRPRAQRGSASFEYLWVVVAVVTTLIVASDGNPLFELAQAIARFYTDYSFAISLATP